LQSPQSSPTNRLALCASPRVRAIEVAEFDPAGDPHGLFARHLVALVVRAVTRQLKARKA